MAGTTDAFLPPGVALASADDDDERSLDENLRPMDGQIWLVDVDAGLTDPFHISTVSCRSSLALLSCARKKTNR